MNASPDLPTLSHGRGSFVYGTDGREWIDLVMGFGAAFLGHSHPGVTEALHRQAERLLSCGRYPTEGDAAVEVLQAGILPRGLRPAGLASSGMEAAEFAMRLAATHTGRHEFAGFARSMHGKSAMTASLCWSNAPLRPGSVHTLPFIDTLDEAAVLDALHRCLRSRHIAALLIEPVQGSNGAHQASAGFYARAMALCRAEGTLCIVDEILTGLYRTGPAFFCDAAPEPPDMLLFAKNMGNGFPVSALALAQHIQIGPQALPGSTFAGNPFALAAVQATLECMAGLPMTALVLALEATARRHFEPLRPLGVRLRGGGALWCLELAPGLDAARMAARIRDAGILVSLNGRVIRLLPAATIAPDLWDQACARIANACLDGGATPRSLARSLA